MLDRDRERQRDRERCYLQLSICFVSTKIRNLSILCGLAKTGPSGVHLDKNVYQESFPLRHRYTKLCCFY